MTLSSRTSSIILSIALAACSARGGGGGGGGGGDPDASSPTGACASLCARVVATSGCTTTMTDCVASCSTLIGNPSCASQSSAFTSCAGSSAIVCAGSTPGFTDCMSQQAALLTCITSAPPPDASTLPDTAVQPDVVVRPDSTVTPDVPTQPDVVRPDATTDASVTQLLCSMVCDHVSASPGCSAAASSCASMCGSLSTLPAMCESQVLNYLGCLTEAPIDCSSGTPAAPACASVQSALASCLSGGPRDSGVDVPTTGDPTAACTTATWGTISRECGWRRSGSFSCTPGRSYSVGCNSTAGTTTACTTPIGSCSGDPVLRVCSGTTTCSGAAALSTIDDTCGNCPVATITCPTSGQITVLTGDYSNSSPGTCVVAIR